MNRSIFALVALALALRAAPAAADPADDRGKAASSFRQGQAYFQRGDYERAIAEYQTAFELSKEPSLIFNIGLCHTRANRPEQALASYKRYLELAPEGDVADEAREEIARLTPLVEKLTTDREAKRKFDEAAEAQRRREAAYREALEKANAPPSPIPRYVMIGGAAVMVVGAVTHVLMWRTGNQLESDHDPDAYIGDRDTFRTQRAVAITGYAVGAAAALTGLILHFTVFRRPEAPQLSAAVAPQSAMLTLEWSR